MRPGSDDSIPRTRYPFSRLCPRPIHRTIEVEHIAVVTEEVEGGPHSTVVNGCPGGRVGAYMGAYACRWVPGGTYAGHDVG